MERELIYTAAPADRALARARNNDAASIAWFALFVAAVFSVPMLPYMANGTDLTMHIDYAKRIKSLADITSPHFLFQAILIAANQLTGTPYASAAIALMSGCYGAMATLIAQRIRRGAPQTNMAWLLGVSIAVLLASHVFLQSAYKLNFYFGYIAPVVYHNPTQVLCKALALVTLFAYFAIAFDGRKERWLKVLLPLAVVLSALAKPSFLIAFLPCMCIIEVVRALQGPWRSAARNLALVVLPAAIVLALQFQMSFGSSGNGLAFAPFKVYGGSEDVLIKLPASLFFPVVAIAVIRYRQAVSSRLLFAWLLYAIGMLISLCAVETGPRMMDGNFAWTGQVVTFILYVESVIALFAVSIRNGALAWCAFALHVAFGLIWYLAAYMWPIETFW